MDPHRQGAWRWRAPLRELGSARVAGPGVGGAGVSGTTPRTGRAHRTQTDKTHRWSLGISRLQQRPATRRWVLDHVSYPSNGLNVSL